MQQQQNRPTNTDLVEEIKQGQAMISAIAEKHGISPQRVSQIFKRVTGQSYRSYVNHVANTNGDTLISQITVIHDLMEAWKSTPGSTITYDTNAGRIALWN
jgi:YesN/AraC family two-component response regulator